MQTYYNRHEIGHALSALYLVNGRHGKVIDDIGLELASVRSEWDRKPFLERVFKSHPLSVIDHDFFVTYGEYSHALDILNRGVDITPFRAAELDHLQGLERLIRKFEAAVDTNADQVKLEQGELNLYNIALQIYSRDLNYFTEMSYKEIV